MKYKKGDTVERINKDWNSEGCTMKVGDKGKILGTNVNDNYTIEGFGPGHADYNLKLVNNNMNLKEKFVLSITKEPKKSFRKVGVTDGDDLLTPEGQCIFLSWLLHTVHATTFKKDVIDDMLKEQKKEEKNN